METRERRRQLREPNDPFDRLEEIIGTLATSTVKPGR